MDPNTRRAVAIILMVADCAWEIQASRRDFLSGVHDAITGCFLPEELPVHLPHRLYNRMHDKIPRMGSLSWSEIEYWFNDPPTLPSQPSESSP